MAGASSKLFVNIDIVFGNKKLSPQEMSAEIVALQSKADQVSADEKMYREMLAVDKKTIEIDLRAAQDAHAAKTDALRAQIDDLEAKIVEKQAKITTTNDQAAAIQGIQDKIDAKNDQIAAEVAKLDAQVSGLKVAAKLVETDLKATQAKTQNWWYVFNGLMHLADRLMDKSKSDFSHYFGLSISIITSVITSMHAISVGLAASGPAGMIQAGIIVSSNLLATVSLIQAEAQTQALEANKNNIGEMMFG